MSISLGNVFDAGNIVLWPDYDADGDGYLSPSEYDAYISAGGFDIDTIPRITQEDLDAIEADAGSGTSVSPYEDGSASDSFYGNWGFPVPDTEEEETEAALIAAAETGNIDVIEAILSTASNAVSGAVLNTVMETFYDSLDIPAGLDDLSGYGSTPRPDYKIDLDSLADMYLDAGSGNETPLTLMDAQGLALGEHMRAVKDAQQRANAYVDAYGGSFYDYFVMPNQLVELSPLAQEYDANRDGSLDQDEMVGYTEAWEKENGIMRFADGTSATAATAEAADLDGDGQISPQELSVWEADRASDTDPNPSRTAFLADYGFDASPSAAWVGKFARESAESFQTGAQQILTQSLQDAALGLLNSIQQGMLTQVESGESTVTRPTLDKDDPSYALIGQDIDSYLDRIFAGKDTISRDALLTNDEFYDVGIQLATTTQRSLGLEDNDAVTITDTDQALVDRYVAVRDDYQESIAEPETPIGRFLNELQADVDELFKDAPETDVKAQAAKKGLNTMLQGAEALFEQDAVQTTQAVTLKAAGELMQTAASIVAMVGQNPKNSKIYQIGEQWAALGNETYTEEFQTALKDIDSRIGAAEGFWDTAEAIFGSIQDHPTEFLVDVVVNELIQEIPILLATRGTSQLTRGALKAAPVAKEVVEKIAENAGFATGVVLDLAEAMAGGAGQAYGDAMENLLFEEAINEKTGRAYTQQEAEAIKQMLIDEGRVNKETGKPYTQEEAEEVQKSLLRRAPINPDTGKAYTQEEAEAKAGDIANNTGLLNTVIVAAQMAIGGNLFEKAISVEDGVDRLGRLIFKSAPEAVKKAINKYLGEMGTRIIGTGVGGVAEGLQEGSEGALVGLSIDLQMEAAGDLDRDYGKTAATEGIIGSVTGFGVGTGIGGASTVSYWVKASNAQVAAAVAAAKAAVQSGADPKDAAAQLQTELTDLGVDNDTVQNDLANSVDDAGYLTEQEVFDTATQLGVDLLPGQIEEFAGQTDELAHMEDLITDLTKNVYGAPSDAEFDVNGDGVLTGQELVERAQAMEAWEAENPDFEQLDLGNIAELDTDGVTGLSREELTAYAAAVGESVTNRQTSLDDTRARFRALGYEPSNSEVFEYSAKKNEIPGYVDPRQLTREELEAAAATENYTLKDSDYSRVGQGGADFETTETSKATTAFDPLAVTTQEIKDAATSEGVTLTTSQAEEIIATMTLEQDEATFLASKQPDFDARAVTYAEAKAELIAQGVPEPTDLQIRSYVGEGDETFQQTQYDSIKTFGAETVAAAELAENKENIRTALVNLGYTPSQTEIDSLVGKTDEEIAAYADPRVVTEAEARTELQRLGITNPTDEQLAQYVGSGNETFQDSQFGRIENYADPRVVTEEEARTQLISEGITDPTPEQIAAYVGEGDETFQQTQYDNIETAGEEAEAARLAEVTEAEALQLEKDKTAVNNVLTAAGYTSASNTELENLVGKTNAEIEAYANPRVVTEAEARAELIRQGISDPTQDEIDAYKGQGDENFQSNQETKISQYADPRVVTEAEATAELIAQGISPEEAAKVAKNYSGEGDENFETNQETKINEDTVTEAELQSIAAEQGYTLSTDDVNKYTGVKNQETELAAAGIDFDSRALNVEEIEAAAAAVGYTLEEGEAEKLVRNVSEGTTEAEAITQQENTFNNQSVTLEELQAIAAAQGYELQGDPVEGTGDYAFIGNRDGANNFLTTKEQEFNDLAITEAELEAAALAAGYSLTDTDRGLIGNVGEGESAATILEGKQTEFASSVATAAAATARQGYEDTIRDHIKNNAGSFSETEIGNFIDQAVADGTANGAISDINKGITTQRNTTTIATAFPNMSPEEVAALVGQVGAGSTVDQVIQNQKDIDRVEEAFPDLSPEEVQAVLGRVDADNTLTDVITAQQTANTNASNQAALEAAFPDLSPADIDALMGEIAGGKTLEEVIGTDGTEVVDWY